MEELGNCSGTSGTQMSILAARCSICGKEYAFKSMQPVAVLSGDYSSLDGAALRLVSEGSCPDCPVRLVQVDCTCQLCDRGFRAHYTWEEACSGEELLPAVCISCYEEMIDEQEEE